jgi:hypothetical protein
MRNEALQLMRVLEILREAPWSAVTWWPFLSSRGIFSG